jgi:hypothetical protein
VIIQHFGYTSEKKLKTISWYKQEKIIRAASVSTTGYFQHYKNQKLFRNKKINLFLELPKRAHPF